jgi:hypothetical protein
MVRRFAGPLVLLALIVGFYWKLTLTSQYTWLDAPDLAHMDLPRLQFQAVEWNNRRFPLWNPYSGGGQPFLGQVVGGANPLIWLVARMPLRDGFISEITLNRWFVLMHFLGGLFCYLLCRDLKCSRAASVLAGLVFATAGFIGNTDWPQVLTGAIWAPLIFLFLFRAGRGEKPWSSAALSGLFLGMSWLSGHHEVPIYLTFAWGFTWLFFAAAGSRSDRRMLALTLLAVIVMGLTGALQILPGWEYGQLAVRWVGVDDPVGWKQPIPYFVHESYSLTPASVLGIVFPNLYQHANPFLGMAAGALVFLGVACAWEKAAVRWLACLLIGGLVAAMGGFNPLHGLLYAVAPVFGKARVPARSLAVFSFAAAPLVAFGIDVLRRRADPDWIRRTAWVLVGAGVLVFSITLGLAVYGKTDASQPVVFSGFLALAFGALLLAVQRELTSGRMLTLFIGAALMIEMGHGTTLYFRHKQAKVANSYLDRLKASREFADWLKKQPQPFRVNVDDREIPANFGDYWGIDVNSSFGASITENIWQIEMHTERAQDLMGAVYAIQKEPTRQGQEAMYEGAGGLKIYRNPNALPRVWVVHETIGYRDRQELRAVIQHPDFNMRTVAPAREPIAGLEKCGGGDAAVLAGRFSGRVSVDAELKCAGLVVLSETWFPGWQAWVDGRPAPIHEVYGALRGVVVPAGKHRIDMRYRPKTAVWGAILTSLGVLLASTLAVCEGRRPRR